MYTLGVRNEESSMSIDCRTRRHRDRKALRPEEIFDGILPEVLEQNSELAARGLLYKGLPALTLDVEGRSISLKEERGRMSIQEGGSSDGIVAVLDPIALSDLVQDWSTTMGLAMKSRVKIAQGDFGDWIGWEPVFRALLDGRPVHEAGAIDFKTEAGSELDLSRRFDLDDDRAEIAHFLHEAGFLHIRNVFSEEEMAAVSSDLDAALARATPDDGASWWAGDSKGAQQAVRVLYFHEQSDALASLLKDPRMQWLGALTDDDHGGAKLGAEGLVKPLDIQTGLSDLPWHKDCGQGGHSYYCNGLTVGISVTGADERSGALGVVPGSHRANVQTAGHDESLDMPARKLVTKTGDLTIHCSDTLHRAHRPTERIRKVAYSHFSLLPRPGDVVPKPSQSEARAARARLTNVRDRIADSGGGVEV
jgi:hypothetical protein